MKKKADVSAVDAIFEKGRGETPETLPEEQTQAEGKKIQVSAYIPESLYHEIRAKLALSKERQNFTGLLINLLSEWVKK